MKKHKKLLISLAVLFALACTALYQGLTVTWYSVQTDKLDKGQTLRFALVTDLHSYIWGRDQSPLIDKILKDEPDAVLLVGDIYDNVTPPEGVRLLLDGLQSQVPVYYATGNHEYWTGDMDTVLSLFDEYGVITLQDEWTQLSVGGNTVTLAGVCDPVREKWDTDGYDPIAAMQAGFDDLPTDVPSILLAHRPNWITQYAKYPFDVVLSGHNHGGQLRIPWLLDGLLDPDTWERPKYPGGVYTDNGLTHIVSRGIGINQRLPRVFNPPELVFVDLVGTRTK